VNRKLVGLILVVCAIGAFAVINPEQTISTIVAFRDWCTAEPLPEAAQIWRITTINGINDKDLLIDYCNVTRDGVSLGEPDSYHEGYVEFILPVFEGDNVSVCLQKEGFFSKNISFVVPQFPMLYAGMTYYTLARVKMYPTYLLEETPQQVESDYFVNVLIYQIPPMLKSKEAETTIIIMVNATKVEVTDVKIVMQELPEHLIRYTALISPSKAKLKRYEGTIERITMEEPVFFRVDLILLDKPLWPICFQLSYSPSQNDLNVTSRQIWGFGYHLSLSEIWNRSIPQISSAIIISAGGWFYIVLCAVLLVGSIAWVVSKPKEDEQQEKEKK